MEQIDIVSSIYRGEAEKVEKILHNEGDVLIFSINNLMNARHNEEYRIGLIPLILKAEADHPGEFFKYKPMIDLVARVKGTGSVIFSWENPFFAKYVRDTSGNKMVNLALPVSKQMSTYLHHLKTREADTRKRKVALLNMIGKEEETSDPAVKQAFQIVKRQIIKNYRLLCPKSGERY